MDSGRLARACALSTALLLGVGAARAEPAAKAPPTPPAPPAAAPVQPQPVEPPKAAVPVIMAKASHIPEGTDLPIRFDEKLSSKTNTEGDRFTITLADDVKLADGTLIRAGYKGVGEVTAAEKNGMLGKPGSLNVRFNYLKIGDQRVRLRGSRGTEGKNGTGTVVVLTVLFGPLGLIAKGKNVEVKQGQQMTVYVDQDVDLPQPLPAPPSDAG